MTLMKLRFVGNTPLQLISHQKTINIHCYRCVVLHFLLMKTPCIRVRYNPTIVRLTMKRLPTKGTSFIIIFFLDVHKQQRNTVKTRNRSESHLMVQSWYDGPWTVFV
jgi:hypothetical protein